MNTDKPAVPQEVHDLMSRWGKKGGETNKKKGSDYFKYVVSFRKNAKNKAQKPL